jgi:ATP-dependent protease ClpP protease subunit
LGAWELVCRQRLRRLLDVCCTLRTRTPTHTLAHHTHPQVIRELSRNKWMDPKEAVEYGAIDKVLNGPVIQKPKGAPKFRFERDEVEGI